MSAAFTVRLDEATLGALDQLAEKTERSRNWIVTKAIEDYVALHAWQVGKIQAGVAAADRGEFAEDDDVARVRKKFAAMEWSCDGPRRPCATSKRSANTSPATIPPPPIGS